MKKHLSFRQGGSSELQEENKDLKVEILKAKHGQGSYPWSHLPSSSPEKTTPAGKSSLKGTPVGTSSSLSTPAGKPLHSKGTLSGSCSSSSASGSYKATPAGQPFSSPPGFCYLWPINKNGEVLQKILVLCPSFELEGIMDHVVLKYRGIVPP